MIVETLWKSEYTEPRFEIIDEPLEDCGYYDSLDDWYEFYINHHKTQRPLSFFEKCGQPKKLKELFPEVFINVTFDKNEVENIFTNSRVLYLNQTHFVYNGKPFETSRIVYDNVEHLKNSVDGKEVFIYNLQKRTNGEVITHLVIL